MKRYLITTADERSWKVDRPVLFLGEWCCLDHRKSVWSGLDSMMAEPCGLGPEKKLRDSEYVQKVSRQILPELSKALNNFHRTEHSERYWNIVIGHWLQRYVAVTFNRYHALEQALQMHDISATTVLRTDRCPLLAKADSLGFILACDDDLWNHILYSRILTFRGDVPINEISMPLLQPNQIFNSGEASVNVTRHRGGIKQWIKKYLFRVFQMFFRHTDAFIINSSFPFKEEIKLQIALGQIPQVWQNVSHVPVPASTVSRTELSLDVENYTGYERYVRWQLPEVIPTCYLEGYKDLTILTESLPWPKKPKFILTAINYSVDEVFKVWAGSKVEQGIPYFTAQHGGNYATHVYFGNPTFPERSASDRFFTWGWSDGLESTIPAFNFKLSVYNKHSFDRNGGLLLIEFSYFCRILPWDTEQYLRSYRKDQFCFFEALSNSIQQQTTVRLKNEASVQSEKRNWKDKYPHARIDIGVMPIRALIRNSRLVVHSYDSTGVLETLALNIPTMCFWRDGLDDILPDAKSYYELLRDVGIFTDNPAHAAELIVARWDNISGWWLSQKVQHARKVFCARFSREENHPVRTMKSLLTKHT